MAKDIEPRLKLISDYLNIGKTSKNNIFVIPEYQRGYSWTTTQCDELFKNIEDFAQESRSDEKDPYFFGTIIIDCEENKLSLIDGQQRTTTFLLLLKALLLQIEDKLNGLPKNDENETLIDGLKERRNTIIDILYKTDVDTRMDLLKNWNKTSDISLLENVSINEHYKDELKTILSAKTYNDAEQNCHKTPKKQKDNKYTQFFRNFKFFYNKLGEYGESKLNIFAKTLLTECQVIEIKSWRVEQAITMFNSLNSTGLPLSDADIISAKMYSYAGADKTDFNNTWEDIKALVDELDAKKIINIDSVLQEYMYIRRAKDKDYKINDVTTPGIRNYYIKQKENLLRNTRVLSDEFLKIAKIWDKIKVYPVIKLLLKFNENIKIYLISYLNRYEIDDISEQLVIEISECLIRLFAILELVDTGYSSSNFKTFLFNENLKLVDKSYDYEQIKTDFTNHIRKIWKEKDLKEFLAEYDKNILVFLNEYLYAKGKNLLFDFDDNVNIEHIMPASGRNLDSIRTDAGITSKEDFLNIVNKLGNKILLEEEINKSIGNEWFKTKKQRTVEEKSGYKNSTYGIAKDLVNYPHDVWTVDDINKATDKAIDRILDFVFDKEKQTNQQI